MIMQEIDDFMIRQDIEAFNQRIEAAKLKLLKLPATAEGWVARKKLDAKRLYLEDELIHLRKLIIMAEEASV